MGAGFLAALAVAIVPTLIVHQLSEQTARGDLDYLVGAQAAEISHSLAEAGRLLDAMRAQTGPLDATDSAFAAALDVSGTSAGLAALGGLDAGSGEVLAITPLDPAIVPLLDTIQAEIARRGAEIVVARTEARNPEQMTISLPLAEAGDVALLTVGGASEVGAGQAAALRFVLVDLSCVLSGSMASRRPDLGVSGTWYADEGGKVSLGHDVPGGAGPEIMATTRVELPGGVLGLTVWGEPAFYAMAITKPTQIAAVLSVILGAVLFMAVSADVGRASSASALSRRRAERHFVREQENLAISSSKVLGILTVDHSGVISASNDAAMDILKLRRTDIIGRDIERLLPGIFTRAPSDHIVYRHHSGATARMLSSQVNRWIGPDGRERRTILVWDETEKHASLEKIRQNEERWSLAMEGAGIGVFDIDLTKGKSVVSNSWRRVMGLGEVADDFDMQAYFLSRVFEEDLPAVQAADAACLSGEAETSVSTFRIKTPEGGVRWLRSYGLVCERASDGTALRFIGTQVDITASVETGLAFEAADNRFWQAFSNAPVGTLVLDDQMVATEANALMADLTGKSRSQMIGTQVLADIFSAEDQLALEPELRSLSSSGSRTFRGEFCIRHPGKLDVWCVLTASASTDPKSGGKTYILQLLDVSETKKVERLKTEFVATLSHELRTPLTSISGAIGILDMSAKERLTDGDKRLMAIAKSNLDRLGSLINDILDLEKIRDQGIKVDVQGAELGALIDIAREQIVPIANGRDITIKVEGPGDDLVVLVDSNRLLQVLTNLLSNACKYSPVGKSVHVIFGADSAMARIAVVDYGPGVPADFESKLFLPFSRADNSDTRDTGGTGLGLSIARELVIRMGGEMGYERHADKATVFWFSVPLQQVTQSDDREANRA